MSTTTWLLSAVPSLHDDSEDDSLYHKLGRRTWPSCYGVWTQTVSAMLFNCTNLVNLPEHDFIQIVYLHHFELPNALLHAVLTL
jgi:hypothetical protein